MVTAHRSLVTPERVLSEYSEDFILFSFGCSFYFENFNPILLNLPFAKVNFVEIIFIGSAILFYLTFFFNFEIACFRIIILM